MNLDQIYIFILAAGPALSSIIGVIIGIIKMIKSNKNINKEVITKFEELKEKVINTKEYTELKDQLKIVQRENIELKKKLNELLTKIDKIDRSEE